MKEKDQLERLDVRILKLRLGYSVYVAVEQHLNDLFQADISETGPSFVKVVRLISIKCLEELELDPEQKPSTYLKAIQNRFQVILDQLMTIRSGMHPVVQKISGSLRIQSSAECRAGLQVMAERAWQWFQEFITNSGGKLSNTRLAEMLVDGPVALDIRVGNKDFTYCHYLRGNRQIQLLAGNRNALDVFFDLPFYFLHEYVSHAYPGWDDERWRFSEAYLLRAAHKFLDEKLRVVDRPRRAFHGLNFDAVRAATDPKNESDLKRAEDCFVELYDIAGNVFITHLLEWATQADQTEMTERRTILAGFHGLAKDPAAVRAVFQSPYKSFAATQQRLFATVDGILTARKQKS